MLRLTTWRMPLAVVADTKIGQKAGLGKTRLLRFVAALLVPDLRKLNGAVAFQLPMPAAWLLFREPKPAAASAPPPKMPAV